MRVVVFFDGKNFHSGLRETAGDGVRLDFPALAGWLVARSGGDSFWGAHYYTGVERGEAAASDAQRGLTQFLSILEYQPGYFVHRFDRRAGRHKCAECGAETTFSQEKEVDTTIVADILRLAAVNGFDILVLVSGDADLAPAVENVRALGKKVYVATWGWESLAARLRRASFDHIDLRLGLDDFRMLPPDSGVRPPEPTPPMTSPEAGRGDTSITVEATIPVVDVVVPVLALQAPIGFGSVSVTDPESAADAAFLAELSRAQAKFGKDAYVGVSLFLNRWRSNLLDPAPHVRQRILDRLVQKGLVEVYTAPDGSAAVRRDVT